MYKVIFLSMIVAVGVSSSLFCMNWNDAVTLSRQVGTVPEVTLPRAQEFVEQLNADAQECRFEINSTLKLENGDTIKAGTF